MRSFFQFRIITILVCTLVAGALLGLNLRTYSTPFEIDVYQVRANRTYVDNGWPWPVRQKDTGFFELWDRNGKRATVCGTSYMAIEKKASDAAPKPPSPNNVWLNLATAFALVLGAGVVSEAAQHWAFRRRAA